MEPVQDLAHYLSSLTIQDWGSWVSAIANVVMAGGIVLAAKSLRVQKNMHIIDTHHRFQSEIRRLQERMPADINGERIVFTDGERRQVRLYWYAVIDEWFTCEVNNRSPEIRQLWRNFAWGGKSALEHLPLFASEFIHLRNSNPYLLGTHRRFFEELEAFCRRERSPAERTAATDRRVALLFGAPCSGKSSVLKELSTRGWQCLKIDDIIRYQALVQANGPQTLSRASFAEHAPAVCLAVYASLLKAEGVGTVVELGCLFPKEATRHLIDMVALLGVQVRAFHLEISEACAAQRARSRNDAILQGTSDAVPINEPNNMSPFFSSLHANMPEGIIHLPAEHLEAPAIADRIVASAP